MHDHGADSPALAPQRRAGHGAGAGGARRGGAWPAGDRCRIVEIGHVDLAVFEVDRAGHELRPDRHMSQRDRGDDPLGARADPEGAAPFVAVGDQQRDAGGGKQPRGDLGDPAQRLPGVAGRVGDGAEDLGGGGLAVERGLKPRLEVGDGRVRLGGFAARRDRHGHARLSARAAAARGSVMMNSVNCPGAVSTAMLPPCCLTTMSWLMDSPSPVPSPAGLVVKNGLNIFSFTASGMPVPLSRIRISTLPPRFLVVALSAGSKPSPLSALRLAVA